MATKNRKAEQGSTPGSLSVKHKKIGVLVSHWNDEVTENLKEGAVQSLRDFGISKLNIFTRYVPGSFELSLGAQYLASEETIDAVICLGCLVRGETSHFDYISNAVAKGITDVGLKYHKPVIFGVLTTENQEQALERAGGSLGNKGSEAAEAAIQMLGFKEVNS